MQVGLVYAKPDNLSYNQTEGKFIYAYLPAAAVCETASYGTEYNQQPGTIYGDAGLTGQSLVVPIATCAYTYQLEACPIRLKEETGQYSACYSKIRKEILKNGEPTAGEINQYANSINPAKYFEPPISACGFLKDNKLKDACGDCMSIADINKYANVPYSVASLEDDLYVIYPCYSQSVKNVSSNASCCPDWTKLPPEILDPWLTKMQSAVDKKMPTSPLLWSCIDYPTTTPAPSTSKCVGNCVWSFVNEKWTLAEGDCLVQDGSNYTSSVGCRCVAPSWKPMINSNLYGYGNRRALTYCQSISPCSGSCVFTWSAATNSWESNELLSTPCSGFNEYVVCDCDPPDTVGKPYTSVSVPCEYIGMVTTTTPPPDCSSSPSLCVYEAKMSGGKVAWALVVEQCPDPTYCSCPAPETVEMPPIFGQFIAGKCKSRPLTTTSTTTTPLPTTTTPLPTTTTTPDPSAPTTPPPCGTCGWIWQDLQQAWVPNGQVTGSCYYTPQQYIYVDPYASCSGAECVWECAAGSTTWTLVRNDCTGGLCTCVAPDPSTCNSPIKAMYLAELCYNPTSCRCKAAPSSPPGAWNNFNIQAYTSCETTVFMNI